METIYNLYLDESGDFDSDLDNRSENECIVGGILIPYDRVPRDYELENRWIREWRKAFPGQSSLSRNEIISILHHATELDYSIKSGTVFLSLNLFSELGDFIIFENYNKNRIVDSTVTYANILSEGIVQLLLRLALENPSSQVRLNVLVGGRRDMTVSEKRYIDLSVLKTRIEERLKLLEIKNESLRAMGASYKIALGNDKRDTYLIICDYICNFYFRRNAKIYKHAYLIDGRSYSDVLKEKYKTMNIFSLKGNADWDRLAQHITNDSYGYMLFDFATGIIKEELCINNGLRHFLLLPEKSRRLHLSTLSNCFKEVIEVRRDLEMGKKLLCFGDVLISQMEKDGKRDDYFAMELLLYKLTIENHYGNLGEMEQLFGENPEHIGRLMEFSENLDLFFMFLNRYSVFLIDSFNIEKAYLLLEKTIEQFEAYGMISDELSSIYNNSINNAKGVSVSASKSNQLGKLLGTEVQAAGYLMKHKNLDYETVANISNRAIDNFMMETDKQRQYQYRAMIEGYAGHYQESTEYLLKGLNINSLVEGFRKEKSMGGFGLYHLSLFLNHFKHEDTKEIKELKKAFLAHEKDYLSISDYPYFIVSGNVAEALSADTKANSSQVTKFYKGAVNSKEYDSGLIKYLKLMFRCSFVAYLHRIGSDEYESECETIDNICEELMAEDISSRMAEMLREFRYSTSVNKYEVFSNLRQY